jgi:hypothetical protein
MHSKNFEQLLKRENDRRNMEKNQKMHAVSEFKKPLASE